MTPSINIENFIKGFEQLRLKAYMPTPNDVPTIGWGSTGSDIKMGLTWTKEQADARFYQDINRFATNVDRALTGVPTTQAQFDAMVSLAYNIGIAGFLGSSVLANHKKKNYAVSKASFLLWNKQKGKVLAGLVTRREAEAAIYAGARLY